jgi:hypothetical protein
LDQGPKVVEAARKHLAPYRRSRTVEQSNPLRDEVTALYQEIRRRNAARPKSPHHPMSDREIEDAANGIFGKHGIDLSDRGLRTLLLREVRSQTRALRSRRDPATETAEGKIRALKGPSDAADETVAKVLLGMTGRGLQLLEKRIGPPLVAPAAYGSYPGRRGLLRFALKVLDVAEADASLVLKAEAERERQRARDNRDPK